MTLNDFSTACSSASGPTGLPVAFFIHRSGVIRPARHIQIRRDPSSQAHTLEFRAQVTGLLDLFFNLMRDHVTDRVIRQIQERVNHVRINAEQAYVLDAEYRCVVTIPDIPGNVEGRCLQPTAAISAAPQ
jgi:hypothetical protein